MERPNITAGPWKQGDTLLEYVLTTSYEAVAVTETSEDARAIAALPACLRELEIALHNLSILSADPRLTDPIKDALISAGYTFDQ